MATIPVKNWKNKEVRTLELNDAVFDYPLKQHLIYEAMCAHRNAARAGTHKTKNRVEVSGGSRKLWRQKGTGRARVGDNRSPLWRHGGTVHGPRPRSYAWNFPRKMRRNAIRSLLAQKLRDGQIVCLESLSVDSHRTSELEKAVAGLGLTNGKALLSPLEEERNLALAARNNPRLDVVRALGLDVVSLLDYDTLVVSEDALKRLGEVLA